MQQGLDSVLTQGMGYLRQQQASLAAQTRCYEQLALAYYADSLLPRQIYGDVTAYSSGLVEEDATLLTPFARVCPWLKSAGDKPSVAARLGAEQAADSAFYHQNVATRFYLPLPRGIRGRMHWPFVKRNARRLTLSHHITLGDKQYVRLQLSQGRGKGQTILLVLNNQGQVVEHCALEYDYLSRTGY
ncbi:MAG: hypothetical protein EOO38_09220 [Cytophagaceae bacterium]|nr:MAG: hypothetical protein EOO38_09220 [Cytophagaceae bacterium]